MAPDLDAAVPALFDAEGTTVAVDDRVTPHRVYAFFADDVTTPAAYVELVDEEEEEVVVPVVVHNFQDYGEAMRRWDLDPAELVALNELHELTHWAMTDEERRRWDARSQRTGRPDGEWLNPLLMSLVRTPSDQSARPGARPSLWERLRAWLR